MISAFQKSVTFVFLMQAIPVSYTWLCWPGGIKTALKVEFWVPLVGKSAVAVSGPNPSGPHWNGPNGPLF